MNENPNPNSTNESGPDIGQNPPPVPPERSAGDENTWAAVVHLASFAAYVLPFLGGILGPLVVWIIKKEESSFVDEHGKACLNFQISLFIYYIVAAILMFVVIGVFIAIGLWLFSIVMTIIAALKASEGEHFEYPITIRFIK